MSRDWVSVKFGKDIASLIHFHVWKSLMDIVNHEYCWNVNMISGGTNELLLFKRTEFNWRYMEHQPRYRFIYRDKTNEKVAKLPKNYFTIKELY